MIHCIISVAAFLFWQDSPDSMELPLPRAPITPIWGSDGTTLHFVDGAPENAVAYRVDTETGRLSEFLDVSRTRESVAKTLEVTLPYQGLPFESFSFIDEKTIAFETLSTKLSLSLESYAAERVPPENPDEAKMKEPQFIRAGFSAGAPDVYEVPSLDGNYFVFDRDDELWLRSLLDNRERKLTSDGEEEFPWNGEGVKWSPDGYRFVASKVDTRKVPKLPVVHWLQPREEVTWAPYTKAGDAHPIEHLHILDRVSGHATPIEYGDCEDHFNFRVGWRKNGSEFVFLRMNRLFTRLDVIASDAVTGQSRILFTDTSETFIGGLRFHVVWESFVRLLDDGDHFAWVSERSGWNHLYLYDFEGKLVRQLTRGEFPVLGILRADDTHVYFTAHAEPDDMYATPVYRVHQKYGSMERLTDPEGVHSATFSPSGEVFLDTHSTVARAPISQLRHSDGKLIATITKADPKKINGENWKAPERFVVKAADGKTDIDGVLFFPKDFDPEKKYPIIDTIYNGPFITWVPRTFDGAARSNPYTQAGFLVMVVDGRGTPERGKAFQDVVYHAFGQNEIPDHAAALEQIAKTRPYIDTSRVGITGGSWGGYMTVRAMVTHPDVYHVGVAVNSVTDLYDHAAVPIEPYMGLPQDNPEGYEAGSSVKLADQLKGKLLLVHATEDVNATFSATMKMVDALIRAGKEHDLIVIPGEDHWVQSPKARAYLGAQTTRYFVQHLKPGQ